MVDSTVSAVIYIQLQMSDLVQIEVVGLLGGFALVVAWMLWGN